MKRCEPGHLERERRDDGRIWCPRCEGFLCTEDDCWTIAEAGAVVCVDHLPTGSGARAAYEHRRKVIVAINVALEVLSNSDLQAVARFAFRLVPEDERKDGAT